MSAPFAPLAGLRVADFSANIAGPWATMILAQLGAAVIKVEPPQGDDARAWTMRIEGESLVHRHVNVGKRGIVLDLKTEAGRAVARRLCIRSDVVLQSMRPGVAARLGLDRESLLAENPDLLYCDLSGYGAGETGREMPGYDPMVQATAGIIAMNGYDEMPPVRCAPSVVDLGTGQWIAMGVMAAIMARQKGQTVGHLDTALIDTAFSLVPYQATEARITGKRPARAGSGNPIAVPYQCLRVGDGEILVAAPSQRLWERLARALDLAGLIDDPRFAGMADRVRNRPALVEALEARLVRAPAAHWIEVLTRASVPVARVCGLDEAVAGPLAAERGTFVESDGVPLVRLPWRFDGAALDWARRAPRLGEHTAEVLEELGLTEAEIAALTGDAAQGQTPGPASSRETRRQTQGRRTP